MMLAGKEGNACNVGNTGKAGRAGKAGNMSTYLLSRLHKYIVFAQRF